MTAMDDFVTDAQQRMDKSVDATHDHFNSVRTGRASAALLDRITIDYYGTPSPLKNIASISVPEPRLLVIQPFDPTEERRKELVKVIRSMAEDGRIAVRNVRRDAMKHLEELVKNGEVGDDDERASEARVQKLTDEHVQKIDDLLKRKEADVMEV